MRGGRGIDVGVIQSTNAPNQSSSLFDRGESRRGAGAGKAATNKRTGGSVSNTCIRAASSLSFTLEVYLSLSLSLSLSVMWGNPL